DQFIRKRICLDAQRHAHAFHADRPHAAAFARARPQNRRHAALFRNHLGKASRGRLGQQKDGVIKVGLAGSVGAGQHIDLAQVQPQTAYRAVSGYMNFTYGHGCILNETRRIVAKTVSKSSTFSTALLHSLLLRAIRNEAPQSDRLWWRGVPVDTQPAMPRQSPAMPQLRMSLDRRR